MLRNLKKYTFSLGFIFYLPIAAWSFDNFDCVGSEPFWKLSINEQKFTFQLQNEPAVNWPVVKPKPAENMNIDHIRVFRTKEITIIIQKQSCSDSISEDIFTYEGIIIFKDKVFHGCCSKKLILSH